MKPVMWGNPSGTIRWQPRLPNGKRLWVDRGYSGTYKFSPYWARRPEGDHDTPSLFRSYLLARLCALIAKPNNSTWEELK